MKLDIDFNLEDKGVLYLLKTYLKVINNDRSIAENSPVWVVEEDTTVGISSESINKILAGVENLFKEIK